jgi:hypothetical protein
VLSVPLAVAASRVAAGGDADAALKLRLAELDDVDAIRGLNRDYARYINAQTHDKAAALFLDPSRSEIDPAVSGLAARDLGEHDVIELAPGGKTARAELYCLVATETAIGPTCTLVEMARLQGEGVIRRTEPRVLENRYVKSGGVWKIETSRFR